MRFSIVIPVYNRVNWAEEAISSVLNQTFDDYELIVVDDGSDEQVGKVLDSYVPRIQILRQANQGAEVSRHRAGMHARGEYIIFLDSDDLLCRYALQTYDHLLRECGSPPLLLAAKTSFHDGDPKPKEIMGEARDIEASIFPDFLSRNVSMFLSCSILVIRKSTLKETGGPRTEANSRLILDDFHMCLKVGTQGPCVVVQKPATVAYREHSNNAHKNLASNIKAVLSLIEHERNGQYPGGQERRKERYVWIGSVGLHWIRRWVEAAKPWYMLSLFPDGAAMLASAAFAKIKKKVLRLPAATGIRYCGQMTVRSTGDDMVHK